MSTRFTILVIEDEIDILEVLEYNLTHEGYNVLKTLHGETGLMLARERDPDLILLDLMLPGVNGIEVCRRLKQDPITRDIPIIMLTAKNQESDVVVGLGVGADDYIAKPFKPRELLARVAAVLRRSPKKGEVRTDDRIAVNGIVVDALRHEVLVEGSAINLTASEFRIFQLLASQPGRVFTRDQIASRAMGQVLHPSDRNIDVHMKTIRRKLGERADLIETVRGVGYRFSDRPRALSS
jgi:two-component system, OmpR family, alkaline phosphatase synthesis response regulator PhoP